MLGHSQSLADHGQRQAVDTPNMDTSIADCFWQVADERLLRHRDIPSVDSPTPSAAALADGAETLGASEYIQLLEAEVRYPLCAI